MFTVTSAERSMQASWTHSVLAEKPHAYLNIPLYRK